MVLYELHTEFIGTIDLQLEGSYTLLPFLLSHFNCLSDVSHLHHAQVREDRRLWALPVRVGL